MKTQFFYFVKKAFLLTLAFIVPCVLLAQAEVAQNNNTQNRFFDILIDDSNLWIACDAGVIKYDKTTNDYICYIQGGGYNPTLRLAKDAERNIWSVSQGGYLKKFDGKIWTNYTIQSGCPNYAISIDTEDNKWIGTCGSLVKFKDDENREEWITDCGLSSASFITAMALDHDGTLWIGGWQYPYCAFGKFTGDGFEYYSIEDDMMTRITRINVDKQNDIWIGVSNRGLVKYDRQQFTSYTTKNSDLPSDSIHDFQIDKEGNLWLIYDTYLVKFDGTTFTQYNLQTSVSCLSIENNGDIWLGAENALYLFSHDELQPIITFDCFGTSIVENDKPAQDDAFTVFTNASEVVIDFSLPESAQVSLSVFDMQGKEVCSILNSNHLTSGKHQYLWSYTKSSSGVYLVRYVVNGTINVKKVVIP
jgi:streptogramin lyase